MARIIFFNRTYGAPRQRIVLLLLTTFVLSNANANIFKKSVHSHHWTDKYDRHFKKYTKRYFGPFFDWHWFKAQAIAESGLNDKAKSHMGAVGLMQILPSTFHDINKRNPHFDEVNTPRWNIAAGIYYDRTLYRKFNNSSTQDKLYKTFASYNAGYGRMLKAEKRVNTKTKHWKKVKLYLPKETRSYVHRIRGLMGEL